MRLLLSLLIALAAAAPCAGDESRPFGAGVALSLHSQDPHFSYAPILKEIRATGATEVSLLVHFYQENSVTSKPSRHLLKTPSDARLLEAIRSGRELGLRVFVMPILLLEKPRKDDWRGNIKPPKWKPWFAAYRKEIVHFARLAERGGAALFSVGSELSSTEVQLADWRRIIKEVSAVFSGRLTYSANWDHYDQVGFWGQLDVMGISGYYELTNSTTPKRDVLVDAWREVQRKILAWRKAAAVKAPLIFTEVGYASQDGCASKPWNYYLTDKIDLEEQKLCYEVFIEVWDRHPALAGVFFYEWWGKGGSKDPRYTPKGKPAEQVMRSWFTRIRKRNAALSRSAKGAVGGG